MRRVLEDPAREGTVTVDLIEIDERDIRGLEASVWLVNGLDAIVDFEVSGRITCTISGMDRLSSGISTWGLRLLRRIRKTSWEAVEAIVVASRVAMKPQGLWSISCVRRLATTAIQTLAATVTAALSAERTKPNRKCPCFTCGLVSDPEPPAGFQKASFPDNNTKVPREAISMPSATQLIAVTCSRLLEKITISRTCSAAVVMLEVIDRAQKDHKAIERCETDGAVVKAMFELPDALLLQHYLGSSKFFVFSEWAVNSNITEDHSRLKLK